MAHKEYFPNHRVHEIIPEGRKGKERHSKWIYYVFIKTTEYQEDLPRLW